MPRRPDAQAKPGFVSDDRIRTVADAERDAGPWTEAKNRRRCDLIDKEIDGRLAPEAALELESLQRQLDPVVGAHPPAEL